MTAVTARLRVALAISIVHTHHTATPPREGNRRRKVRSLRRMKFSFFKFSVKNDIELHVVRGLFFERNTTSNNL